MKLQPLNRIIKSLNDHEVLVRLNTFILLYFGWLGFTVLYNHAIKYHSRDIMNEFLKLPFTSYDFVMDTVNLSRAAPIFYLLMKAVYYIGFSGSIALTVFFVLIYRRDLEKADELAFSYLLAYTSCGVVYSIFHIHAPHYVYDLPGFYPDRTYLTQQEFVLPSLHNTVAAINILVLWKYREKAWGKFAIGLNSLVPFATIFLGHHWIYDALAGIILAVIINRVARGRRISVPSTLRNIHISLIQKATVLSFLAGGVILFLAITLPKP
ncbi:phosphatase PAP2 family protein [Thermococcus gorgonarius]|uniref:Phosphoesterase n=1 Tax=Thermococcus gorgonarius TaxID=71997 RepID=A0A2Z2M441_THEGO|nr:phosphatase PAP2 family protein [Thermococcus gorgonarius]ASJ00620.1 phosphoesterase [Thermococcus gorgonarius]